MNKLWHWVKAHPWMTGLMIFAAGTLYILFRGSGSSSAAASGTSSAQTAADAQVALGQLQANTALGIAGIQAGVQSQGIAAGAGVANNQVAAGVTNTTTAGNVSLGVAGIQGDVANTSTNATLQASLAQTAALRDIALAPYQLAEDQLNSTAGSALTALEGQVTALTANTQSLANSTAAGFANLNAVTTDWYGYDIVGNVFPGAQPTHPSTGVSNPLQTYNFTNLPAANTNQGPTPVGQSTLYNPVAA